MVDMEMVKWSNVDCGQPVQSLMVGATVDQWSIECAVVKRLACLTTAGQGWRMADRAPAAWHLTNWWHLTNFPVVK
jgi:hypothetical protein